MELNINSIVKAISKGITKCLETIWNEEGELLDMLLLIREDMIEESETFESLQKSRIYNQYQNESGRLEVQHLHECGPHTSCRRLSLYHRRQRRHHGAAGTRYILDPGDRRV